MAFLRIDGYALDVMVDGIEDDDATIESWSRSPADSLIGTTYSTKREYTVHTAPLTKDDANAVTGWVRGRGHHWSFQRPDAATTRFSLVSDEAGITLTTGTSSASALFGHWALRLNTGATTTCTTSFGSEGDWTVVAIHKTISATSYTSYVIRSKAGVVDYWISGATAAGPFTITNPVSVSAASGALGVVLSGRNAAGSAVTSFFGALKVVPYAMNEGMILSLATPFYGNPTVGFARKPYVAVTGTMLDVGGPAVNGAGEQGGLSFKGSTSGADIQPVVVRGQGFQHNARAVTIRLVQR